MLQPAARVFPVRIAVRPVDDSAFAVPFVLAIKIDPVAVCEAGDARGDIDVVRNQ